MTKAHKPHWHSAGGAFFICAQDLALCNVSPMSTPKPKNEREFFPTPEGVVTLLVDVAHDRFEPDSARRPRVLEPSAGNGAIVKEIVKTTNWQVTAVEPHNHQPGEVTGDVTWHKETIEEHQGDGFDLVLMNPPFSKAQEHITTCLQKVRPGGLLVSLVPLAFVHTQKRAMWYRRTPPNEVICISPRPSFSGDGGTGKTEYVLICWTKGHKGRTFLSWTKWQTPPTEAK